MKRILKEYKTTTLGLLLLGSVVGLVACDKATLSEGIGFIIIAVALLFSKDKEFIENFFKRIGNKTPLVILAIALFASCSPQKKLSRLLKKHPELVKTTNELDTAYTKPRSNSAFYPWAYIQNSKDTIVNTTNNVTTKIFYNNDSLFVKSDCPGDTIIYQRTINNYNTGNTNLTWLQRHTELLLGALLAVLLLYIFKLLIAVKKPG